MKHLLHSALACCAMLLASLTAGAQGTGTEKQLYSTTFTEWTDANAAESESQVSWTTAYSHEKLTFSIYNTQVSSTNKNTGKFPDWEGGYLMCSKSDNPYITTSALASVTKVNFRHGATGSNRGWKLWAKGDGDTDWVAISSSTANPASGADVSATVNRTNCQLKFTNLNASQNAYLMSLDIYGNVDFSNSAVLDAFTVNGTKYAADNVFSEQSDGTYAGSVEISKKATMIGTDNPLTDVTAANGDVTSVEYSTNAEGLGVATITVTYKENTTVYKLTVTYKPDYTLTYISTDGTTIGTQLVEKDAAIGTFSYDGSSIAVTTGDNFRGWFEKASGGRKYTTADIVTSDLNLYAVATEIERTSTSKTYIYKLTDKYFYAEDHEGFVVSGEGKFHDTTHGWEFKSGDKVNVLVGGNATIIFDLCSYSGSSSTISVTDKSGNSVGSISAKGSSDGAAASISYTGAEGTLTITFNGGAYLHRLTVVNTTDNPLEKNEAGYYVVNAGDGNNFLATLLMANANSSSSERTIVYLPNGTYDLGSTCLTAINGKNISIVGQSMDGVIIKNTPEAEGIGITATLYNTSNGLYMQDLTLQNALDYYNASTAGRAVCLQDKGSKTICKNVKMLSYQDTYYSNNASQFYWEDSEIHGTVDFLCGDGDVLYNRCKIVCEKRNADGSGECTIAAPYTTGGTCKWGYVLKDCVIDCPSASFNYGRAWGGVARLAYINTTLLQPGKISSKRFTTGGMNVAADKFVEYNTVDENGTVVSPASNILTFTKDKTSNTIETILTDEQASEYTLAKIYPSWTPNVYAAQLATGLLTATDGTLTWDAVEGARAYAVYYKGELQQITSSASHIITKGEAADYTVRVANAMGGFGPESSTTSTAIAGVTASDAKVLSTSYYTTDGMLTTAAQKGLKIKVQTMQDGSKKALKVMK